MNSINKALKISLICSLFFITNIPFLIAQRINSNAPMEISGASSSSEVSGYVGHYKTIAKYIIGASLIVALIVVIYHVATNSPKAKTAITSWIIAVIVYCIAIQMFG